MTDTDELRARLTDEERIDNARAGLCHCGCPSKRVGWFGWRRCVWSSSEEFRRRRNRLEFRKPRADLREWNDMKAATGLLDDRQVHALLSFLVNPWLMS